MGYPAGDFCQIRLGGNVPGDTWSIGYWLSLVGMSSAPSPAQANAWAAGELTGFNTTVWNGTGTSLKSKNGTAVTLASATAHFYHNGVLTVAGTASQTPSAGTVGTPQPNYVARCLTLLTAASGRSFRGRMYLPWTGEGAFAGTGLFLTASAVMTNLGAYFTARHNVPVSGLPGSVTEDVVIMSLKNAVATPVVALRMDNKPDTMHSRDSKLVPTIFDSATL